MTSRSQFSSSSTEKDRQIAQLKERVAELEANLAFANNQMASFGNISKELPSSEENEMSETTQVISIVLNATKHQSRLMWMSFGAWDEFCQFLEHDEKLNLQILNPFCYKKAVSRVQVKINYSNMFKRHYFVLPRARDASLIVSLKSQCRRTIIDSVKKIDRIE